MGCGTSKTLATVKTNSNNNLPLSPVKTNYSVAKLNKIMP